MSKDRAEYFKTYNNKPEVKERREKNKNRYNLSRRVKRPNTKKEQEHFKYIEDWKLGIENGNIGIKTHTLSTHIRRYIHEKFNKRCAVCGWCGINPITGKSPLDIHHIDGDSRNSREDNLILLCPNCHSLTPNYKNTSSRVSSRTYRKT